MFYTKFLKCVVCFRFIVYFISCWLRLACSVVVYGRGCRMDFVGLGDYGSLEILEDWCFFDIKSS